MFLSVQVAKIATERLLILLLENELVKQGKDPEQWSFMPHYFGYEGRCAMPSNFDANYCYSLGFVAGTVCRENGQIKCVTARAALEPSCKECVLILHDESGFFCRHGV